MISKKQAKAEIKPKPKYSTHLIIIIKAVDYKIEEAMKECGGIWDGRPIVYTYENDIDEKLLQDLAQLYHEHGDWEVNIGRGERKIVLS